MEMHKMWGVLSVKIEEKEIIEWIESAGEHPDYLKTLAELDPQPIDSVKERTNRAFWAIGYMMAFHDMENEERENMHIGYGSDMQKTTGSGMAKPHGEPKESEDENQSINSCAMDSCGTDILRNTGIGGFALAREPQECKHEWVSNALQVMHCKKCWELYQ